MRVALILHFVLPQRVLLFAKTQSPGWHPKAARRFGASLYPTILQALHHSVTLADLRQDVQPNGQETAKAMISSNILYQK